MGCAHCSADLPQGAAFCPVCGMPAASLSQMPTALASEAATATARPFSSPPVGRVGSSASVEAGDFAPGAVFAERYRIIGLLGHGGMGDVYRADDLMLGQPVALKFLPAARLTDSAVRARFHAEVRNARQVSHPNVCRVYDLGESQGRPFISMEFVDGEDLASLLRRIGHLPSHKATEIARQLCAGLAAAHDREVLHRDLKPSNIMIDGRGRARITDFGLAVGGKDTDAGALAGTPAYMSPEQLAGQAASVRSDLYALGLVLYELYTGKKAFEAATLAEWKEKHASQPPKPPSHYSADMDPAAERVILRCLEKDAQQRPASALQVAAALPGGDPLAAALAAGETPSPELVAAAGEEGALSLAKAWGLLGSVALLVAAIFALAPFSSDLGRAPIEKSPDALADRAREIIQRAGYTERPADYATLFKRNYDYLMFRASREPSRQFYPDLGASPGSYSFLYRQSPAEMIPNNVNTAVASNSPAFDVPGMVRVWLDSSGRLLEFEARPPGVSEPPASTPPIPDWTSFFAHAGLDLTRFQAAAPRWVPELAFDARLAWEGTRAEKPGWPLTVTAASFQGQPVYFRVAGPWDQPPSVAPPRAARTVVANNLFAVVLFTTFLVAGYFARHNLKLGRGDRQGAFRIACYAFVLSALATVLRMHHVSDLLVEWMLTLQGLGSSLLVAGFVWLAYLAVEPFIRRRWPELLISWSRLLAGRFRDPLVGKEGLLGMLIGLGVAGAAHLVYALPNWWDIPRQTTVPHPPLGLRSLVGALSALLFDHLNGVTTAFGMLTTFLLLGLILRKKWLATAVLFALAMGLNSGAENVAYELPLALFISALLVLAVTRVGLWAAVVAHTLRLLMTNAPLILDFSRWHVGRTVVVLLLLTALAVYFFRVSLAGRPAFGSATLD